MNTPSEIEQSIRNKIQKLLNLSNNNSNKEESSSSRVKAYELMRKYNFHESEFIVSPSMACSAAPSYASSENSNFDGCNAKNSYDEAETTASKYKNYATRFFKMALQQLFVIAKTIVAFPFFFIWGILVMLFRFLKDWLLLNAGIAIMVTGLYFVLLFFLYPRMQFSVQHLMMLNIICLGIYNWQVIIGLFAVAFALYGLGILH